MRRIVGGTTILLTALALATTTAACSSSNSSDNNNQATAGGTFTLGVSTDPGNLDPQRSANESNLQVSMLAYSPLVILNSDHQLQPAIATSWQATNPLTWSITIRSGVTCSDGTTMDAQTVADNINYVGNPKGGSGFTGFTVPSGATASASGNVVTVKLPSPSPFFMQDMSDLPLVCEKGLKDRSSLASASDGTGPYQIASVIPGASITYTLRKDYTPGLAGDSSSSKLPSTIVVKIITSMTTTANLILNSQLNGAIVTGTDQKRLQAAHVFSVGQGNITDELFFYHSPSQPTGNQSVRTALLMGINMNQLAASDTAGLGAPATGMLATPKVCPGDTVSGNLPSYDVSEAKKLLIQAGYTLGSNGYFSKNGKPLTVGLAYDTGVNTVANDAQVIQAEWQQIGVQTTLIGKSNDEISTDVNGGTFSWDALLYDLGFQTPAQMMPFLSGEAPPNGANFGNINNSTYNSLTAKALSEAGTSGCADWNAAESALFKAADVAPVGQAPFQYYGMNATFAVSGNDIILAGTIRVQ